MLHKPEGPCREVSTKHAERQLSMHASKTGVMSTWHLAATHLSETLWETLYSAH